MDVQIYYNVAFRAVGCYSKGSVGLLAAVWWDL